LENTTISDQDNSTPQFVDEPDEDMMEENFNDPYFSLSVGDMELDDDDNVQEGDQEVSRSSLLFTSSKGGIFQTFTNLLILSTYRTTPSVLRYQLGTQVPIRPLSCHRSLRYIPGVQTTFRGNQ
jgi:hypothetical protein